MTRPLRIQFDGAVYHLMVQAHHHKSLFHDDIDRQRYLDLLDRYKDRFCCVVYAFALLRSEVHLLLETPQANVSKMMQGLGTSYTQYFNRRHRRSGALFVGRYKSYLVDKDTCLTDITRYIHRTHFRPGLSKRLRRDYPWSSYRAYLGRENSLPLDTATVLSKFGFRPEMRKRNYRDYVENGGRKNPYPMPIISQQIIGPEDFAEKIVSDSQTLETDSETTALRKANWILGALSLSLGPEEFLRSREKNSKALLRHVAMYIIRRQTMLPLRAIGAMLGVKASAVALAIVRLEKRLKQGNASPLINTLLRSASFVPMPVVGEPSFQGRGAATKEKDQKIDANRS